MELVTQNEDDLVTVALADGGTTQSVEYTYNENGELAAVRHARGAVTVARSSVLAIPELKRSVLQRTLTPFSSESSYARRARR